MDQSETSGPEDAPPNKRLSDNMVAFLILAAVVVLLALWAASTIIWGIPGLYIPALALVLVSWVALIVISFG